MRLHGVARAALEGRLDVSTLKGLGPEAAMTELQSIKGIGPFYSALIVIRGTGFTDVLPVGEPRALALTAQLYGLDKPPSEPQFRAMAEPWRPFRTWPWCSSAPPRTGSWAATSPRRLLLASLGRWADFSVLASSRSPCRGPARNRTSTCRRSA